MVIYVNDEEISREICTGDDIDFDFYLQNSDLANIKLVFPNAMSPNDLEGSPDCRELALALHSVTIEGRNTYE